MKKLMVPLSIWIALLVALATISNAAAAPAKYVHIEVHEYVDTSGETFYASGAAVDAGLICDSGQVYDGEAFNVSDVGSTTSFQIVKTFDCGDGTFDLQLSISLNTITHGTSATWSVVDGTGAYASLQASGSLVGTPGDVPGVDIYDTYNGIAR